MGATSSHHSTQNTAIDDSNLLEEMSFLNFQTQEQLPVDTGAVGQDWSYTSPLIGKCDEAKQHDHIDQIFNVFATPNEFEAIQFNEHSQKTAASSTLQTLKDQSYSHNLSDGNQKNLLSESVLPNSDDREMSLLVDNLLIEEDCKAEQHSAEHVSAQAASVPRDALAPGDDKKR